MGRAVALTIALATALSCQAVFGDYRIDTSDVVGGDERCEPGESRCVEATLETCAPDGLGFQREITCESAALCNVDTEGCTRCTPEQFQCNGAVLRRCASDATWTKVETCESPRLCTVSDDKRQGSCMEACEPFSFRCTPGTLERCSRAGESWDPVETCASPALCSVALAQQQADSGAPAHCTPPVCRMGESLCDDGGVRRCNTALSGWDPPMVCPSKDQCNPKSGACSPCTPGEHACSGGTVFTCSAGGKWERGADCASPALCDATTGTCREPQCDAPGAYRCDPGDVLLQRCRTDLTSWETLEICGSFDLCNASEGRCESAACRSNTVRCQGARRERCTGNLTGWELVETCDSDELCDPISGCTPGECAANTTRCNDRFLERCVDGRWARVDRCVTRELCQNSQGTCEPPKCEALAYTCMNEVPARCDPGRTGYVSLDPCMDPERCDPATGTCL